MHCRGPGRVAEQVVVRPAAGGDLKACCTAPSARPLHPSLQVASSSGQAFLEAHAAGAHLLALANAGALRLELALLAVAAVGCGLAPKLVGCHALHHSRGGAANAISRFGSNAFRSCTLIWLFGAAQQASASADKKTKQDPDVFDGRSTGCKGPHRLARPHSRVQRVLLACLCSAAFISVRAAVLLECDTLQGVTRLDPLGARWWTPRQQRPRITLAASFPHIGS